MPCPVWVCAVPSDCRRLTSHSRLSGLSCGVVQEMLKSRKHGVKPSQAPSSSTSVASNTSSRHNNKRYLILTYRVEYDRVHYPLPLAFEEVPSVSSLQRVIRRLRKVRARLSVSET